MNNIKNIKLKINIKKVINFNFKEKNWHNNTHYNLRKLVVIKICNFLDYLGIKNNNLKYQADLSQRLEYLLYISCKDLKNYKSYLSYSKLRLRLRYILCNLKIKSLRKSNKLKFIIKN